jgi:two-component system chemotaxis response regulator CheY
MKIMVVDDSRAMRGIILRTLRHAGFGNHDIVEASNGAEALRMIEQGPPDLVLCDWNMPEMSGIDLLRALNQKGRKGMKFGFVTSEGTPDIEKMASDAGAAFLLTKPFTADSLKSALAGIA